MTKALQDLGEYIAAALPQQVLETEVSLDELVVKVRRDTIVQVMKFLRDDANCLFKLMADLCGVDYPEREERFEVVYNLASLSHNTRVRIKLSTDEDTPVPSIVEVYNVANWFEREAWDMFGIMFSNHPDLRRLLTDYGFEGHPLRKEFPLTGYTEVRYDDEKKRVVYEPVKLTQDFRNFDFLSPWEGAPAILPGDEKAEEGSK